MITLLLTALALASDPSGEFDWGLPPQVNPVAGECADPVDLVVGQPLPSGLVDDEGIVRCYATVVPTSDLADLLAVDAWAVRAVPRGHLLTLDLQWERDRRALLEEPPPLLQRPHVQRQIGRAETFVIMTVALLGYAALDNAVIQ